MGKKVAKLSVLCALSLITFMVENLLPPLIIPGAKLGLGNIFVMLTLIYMGLPQAFVLVLAKSLLSAIIVGNIFSLAFSFTAGVLSLIVTYLMLRFLSKNISVLSIASTSACCHNLTQLCVFWLLNANVNVMLYAPYLALLGLLSGLVTGFIVYLITKKDLKVLVS